MIQSWENLVTDRQTDRQTDGQRQTDNCDFTGCCLTNVESPKQKYMHMYQCWISHWVVVWNFSSQKGFWKNLQQQNAYALNT